MPRTLPSLHLKIRVILTKSMTAETARLLLARAVTTGRIPAGIEIRWLDWRTGVSGRARSGRYPPNLRRALRDFYQAMVHPTSYARFEKVG